jgi:hypothetical protein
LKGMNSEIIVQHGCGESPMVLVCNPSLQNDRSVRLNQRMIPIIPGTSPAFDYCHFPVGLVAGSFGKEGPGV